MEDHFWEDLIDSLTGYPSTPGTRKLILHPDIGKDAERHELLRPEDWVAAEYLPEPKARCEPS